MIIYDINVISVSYVTDLCDDTIRVFSVIVIIILIILIVLFVLIVFVFC